MAGESWWKGPKAAVHTVSTAGHTVSSAGHIVSKADHIVSLVGHIVPTAATLHPQSGSKERKECWCSVQFLLFIKSVVLAYSDGGPTFRVNLQFSINLI